MTDALFDLPFEINIVIYVSLAGLVIGLLMFTFFVIGRLFKRSRRGATGGFLRFISILIWILCSAAVLFFAAFVQSYKTFTKKVLVAEVRSYPLADSEDSIYLEVTPIDGDKKLPTKEFILKGNQWALEGDIIKWNDWVNFLGIHTQYKLTRVRGRYLNAEKEGSQAPTVFSLIEDEERPPWNWLYRYGHKLPFVQAVYGNTVYTFPSREHVYRIYVTTSGFSIQTE